MFYGTFCRNPKLRWNSASAALLAFWKCIPLVISGWYDGEVEVVSILRRTWHFHFSFSRLSRGRGSNPRSLRPGLKASLADCTFGKGRCRASTEWVGIGSPDLANGKNKWPLRTVTRELEDISAPRAKDLLSPPLTSRALSLRAPLSAYVARAFRVSGDPKKGLWVSIYQHGYA